MKISYYDLLGMIKENKIPKKMVVRIGCSSKIYIANFDKNEFNYYSLEGEEDENYKEYLTECFLESMMFDKCIEIVQEDYEITKLENEKAFYCYAKYEEYKHEMDKIIYILRGMNLTEEKIDNMNTKINELIDEVNKLKGKSE